jgi:hypothetical protein
VQETIRAVNHETKKTSTLLQFGRDVETGREDRSHEGQTLRSFGVNPGGYIGFFNPQTGKHETFSRKADKEAEKRMKIKLQAKTARRAIRYQRYRLKPSAAK